MKAVTMKKTIIKHSILFAALFHSAGLLAQNNIAHTFNTKVEYSYVVKSLPNLNTAYSEFCAVVTGNRVVLTSDREFDLITWGESNWKKNKRLNIFSAGFKSPADDSIVIKGAEIFN